MSRSSPAAAQARSKSPMRSHVWTSPPGHPVVAIRPLPYRSKYSCAIDWVRSISHHPAFLDPSGFEIHGWESVLRHKFHNVSRLILILKTGSDSKRRASTRLLATAADAIYYIGFRYLERFNA